MSSKSDKIVLMDPQDRLKVLMSSSNAVEVDPHVPPIRYYRCGVEMVRMANVYYEEGNLENAYVLYLKYMTLFIEKIRKHPGYANVPITQKQINQQQLREILPKAEKLKQELLQRYNKEYKLYKLIKEKEEEEERLAKAKEEAEQFEKERSRKTITVKKNWEPSSVIPSTPAPVGNISYPTISEPETEHTRQTGPLPSVLLTPSVDRSNKPLSNCTSTIGSALRTVVIPASVMPKFLMLAKHNTLSNIETCGILAGILEQNQLIITHMIVPKQKGTADSCATMKEEEIFDYQDQHNLITIGWIHTHPTQTAFLSSVDLHTHCPYQLLMPEAIAIVCAPKYNDTGIFVLTPNHGLSFISNCRNTGFHPHPTDPPLFMCADHIKIESNSTLEVLDLRV